MLHILTSSSFCLFNILLSLCRLFSLLSLSSERSIFPFFLRLIRVYATLMNRKTTSHIELPPGNLPWSLVWYTKKCIDVMNTTASTVFFWTIGSFFFLYFFQVLFKGSEGHSSRSSPFCGLLVPVVRWRCPVRSGPRRFACRVGVLPRRLAWCSALI